MLPYINVTATTRETQELNNNVSRVFGSLFSNPLLGKLNIIRGISFTSGQDTLVNHKLGKAVDGFIVTNSDTAVNVFQSSTINNSSSTSIILKSNANAIVDILFF